MKEKAKTSTITPAPAPSVAPSIAPAVILLGTQLGENIGAAMRAMHNFGLSDLRLVAPKQGWSRQRAQAAAAGGASLLQQARQTDSLEEAIADLHYVVAVTARQRDMNKQILTPKQAITQMTQTQMAHNKSGMLFGPERSGLDNQAIALCDAIVEIPANPDFPSLNLAQAVLILSYHWYLAKQQPTRYALEALAPQELAPKELALKELAPKRELMDLFAHLEQALENVNFFHLTEKRPIMVRNLRNIFHRAHLSSFEIKALRGVIAALTSKAFAGKTFAGRKIDNKK